jgi:hypothetical protein
MNLIGMGCEEVDWIYLAWAMDNCLALVRAVVGPLGTVKFKEIIG